MMRSLLVLALLTTVQLCKAIDVNVLDFGAKGDGKTLDTKAIQLAIEAVAQSGGGKVTLPGGKVFKSGSLFLHSHVQMHIQTGAVLLGSPNKADYVLIDRPLFYYQRLKNHPLGFKRQHLLNVMDCKNVIIDGGGTIDGSGRSFWKPFADEQLPMWIEAELDRVSNLVEVHRCSNLKIKDITLKNSPEWTLHIFDSEDVQVDGITIDNGLFGPNNDGIDITGSRRVRVANCNITTCDDGICLKSAEKGGPCENIAVSNCIIQTSCVALKIGSETFQDIRNVLMNNCVVTQSSRAIGIYSVHGGTIENIRFSNIVANTNAPLVLNRPIQIMSHNTKDRHIDSNIVYKPGLVRNIWVEDFFCETEGRIFITAEEGHWLENIHLNRVNLQYAYIESPNPLSSQATSSHFAGLHPDDKIANAAIICRNIRELYINDLQLQWPEKQLPKAWKKHPVKIENGSHRRHQPDYTQLRPVEFDVLEATNIQGGYIDSPLSRSSQASGKTWKLRNSKIQLKE
jgi:hypothetical protein